MPKEIYKVKLNILSSNFNKIKYCLLQVPVEGVQPYCSRECSQFEVLENKVILHCTGREIKIITNNNP